MTDLLMRLAERTLGTAPTARPVIASMFESMPATRSSLSTPEPAFSEVEEMVDADALAQLARPPHTPIITRPASAIIDQQPPVPPMSPIAKATSGTTLTRASIASRQVAHVGAPSGETQQDAIVSIPREQVGHAAPLPAKTPPNVQALPQEIHEQSLARTFAEQRRAAEALPMLHQQEQTRREADPTSLLVQVPRQEVTPAQYISREVIALETAPALSPQQQGRRHDEGSTAQEAGRTRPGNEGDASQGDQLMLVSTRSATQIVRQSIEQAPANRQSERGIKTPSSRRAASQQVGQLGSRIVEKPAPVTAEAPAEAPTIRVTIGRIDVRAVTPAAPPARAKPTRAGPTVSLEEYTRQNRGGR